MNIHRFPQPGRFSKLNKQTEQLSDEHRQQPARKVEELRPQLSKLPKSLRAVLGLLAVTVVAIFLSGLAGMVGVGGAGKVGRDASNSDSHALQAAAASLDLPTQPVVEPDATATEAPGITYTPRFTPRPTRTRLPTITAIPTAQRTAAAATEIARLTHVAAGREARHTRVALTQAPTITPGRPLPQPSPTFIMGELPGCGNINSAGPQAYSCWRALIDGQIVEIYAGREGRDGNPAQGLVWVRIRGQGQQGMSVYQTPQQLGAVRITAVNGSQVTVEPVGAATPQQEFVFDIQNRQWLSP